MDIVWEFLSVEQNRQILQWVAGGVATAVAAIWTLVKFFTARSKSEASAPQLPLNQKITVKGGGKAAGRDINEGIGGFTIFMIVIFTLAISVLLATKYGDRILSNVVGGDGVYIPRASLDLSCTPAVEGYPAILSSEEFKAIELFGNTLYENAGKLVYASVAIERTCSACPCERLAKLDANSEPEYETPEGWEVYGDSMDDQSGLILLERNVAPRLEGFFEDQTRVAQEGLEMWVWLNGAPFAWNFYFPRTKHLSDRQYRSGAYGAKISFDGVFVPRVEEGTGYGVTVLEPAQISDSVFAKLLCIREDKADSLYNKIVFGC